MKIGYDAKRAFFNYSGLGNYSRNLIEAMLLYFPENEYLLYSPPGFSQDIFRPELPAKTITPQKGIGKLLPSYWRSFLLTGLLKKDRVSLFHGLSAELPAGLQKTGIPSIVTIHDLIFIRYPGLYPFIDRQIYLKKTISACRHATRIVAISKQTRDDITRFLGTDTEKTDIVYQSCHARFFSTPDKEKQQSIRKKYNLPSSFILYVGTIEERKNLLGLVKGIEMARPGIPLVVAGKPKKYAARVKEYISTHDTGKVIFLDNTDFRDLPFIYRSASLFVYPSFFEGFGIPIIEALVSGVPVITSRDGCFSEAGGPATRYIDPHSPESIAEAIMEVLSDDHLRSEMIREGKQYVKRFSPENVAKQMIKVYEKTIRG